METGDRWMLGVYYFLASPNITLGLCPKGCWILSVLPFGYHPEPTGGWGGKPLLTFLTRLTFLPPVPVEAYLLLTILTGLTLPPNLLRLGTYLAIPCWALSLLLFSYIMLTCSTILLHNPPNFLDPWIMEVYWLISYLLICKRGVWGSPHVKPPGKEKRKSILLVRILDFLFPYEQKILMS